MAKKKRLPRVRVCSDRPRWGQNVQSGKRPKLNFGKRPGRDSWNGPLLPLSPQPHKLGLFIAHGMPLARWGTVRGVVIAIKCPVSYAGVHRFSYLNRPR
jgi:hypothetical protein